MKDQDGKEIKVGDMLAWSTMDYYSAVLKKGKVVAVEEDCIKAKAEHSGGWSFLRRPHACLVIPS